MAKVSFGALATDARNKISGIVYSKNAAGSYVRVKVSPTQAATARRGLVRGRVTSLSKYFSATLTADQIAAWNSFAKNNPVKDVFGKTMSLSGIQTFVRLNSNILNVGGTQIDDPPASLDVVGIETITVTAAAGTPAFSIAFTTSPLGANHKLSVMATQQLPLGRNFTKSYRRWIFASAAAATTPANILSAYTTKFGALTEGAAIGVFVSVVNDSNGAMTTPLYQRVIVAA